MRKFNSFYEAYNYSINYNSSLEMWQGNTVIPVYLVEQGKWVVLRKLENYGTLDNPVVELGQDEIVLSAGWLNPDTGDICLDRCLGKAACDYCDKTCSGCRYDPEYNEQVEIWYF